MTDETMERGIDLDHDPITHEMADEMTGEDQEAPTVATYTTEHQNHTKWTSSRRSKSQ